jgi:hypothetical protein
MKERGLLLGDKWVRKLRANQKTQTRRPINLKNLTGWEDVKWLASTCPLGVPGDRLYTRECWGYDLGGRLRFRADDPELEQIERWRPSIHMPRRLSRDLLEITAVRAEPVDHMSYWDAIAEGCSPGAPRSEYKRDWTETYGKDYPWTTSWAYVITFKRLTKTRRPR